MSMAHVARWDVVTIGNISRNRYWGESDERACRPALCTCTLITGVGPRITRDPGETGRDAHSTARFDKDAGGFRLLVDPSVQDDATMRAELDRRTGCKLDEVDAVFITHEHGDHHFGLKHFPNAVWLAAPSVAAILNESGQYVRTVEPAIGPLFGIIEVIATPGHCSSHPSLRFDCDGKSVVIAADAAMTRDFWNERRGYFNSADFAQATASIEALARVADVVVPGHDNYFLTAR